MCRSFYGCGTWWWSKIVHKYVFLGLTIVWKCNNGFVTKKERVRKHSAHWLPSTNPGAHVLLIYSTGFRPLIVHDILTASWSLQMNITRSETYKCLAYHTTTERALQHPSLASDIHTNASKGNSFITLHIMYIPWKHKLAFPAKAHKNIRSPMLSSLSLYNSSAIARPTTRRSGKF